jgi:8-hydroxy-5-deazaflavin:NADPH oxidoreductase
VEVAIIGTGNIGSTLARHWHRAGHRLHLGSRDPADVGARELAEEVSASLGTPAEAAARGEVVALAIPGGAVGDTVRELTGELASKTIVVPANQMGAGSGNIAGEVDQLLPGARVIRAFNTLPFELIASAELDGEQLDMLYACSEDADEVAGELISACGLRPVRVGGIEQAALLDDLFALWATLAFGGGRGRRIAFALRGA